MTDPVGGSTPPPNTPGEGMPPPPPPTPAPAAPPAGDWGATQAPPTTPPAGFQVAAVEAGPAPGVAYADLVTRIIAFIIDGVILSIATYILALILGGIFFAIGGLGGILIG